MLAKVLYTLRQRFSHLYLLHLSSHGTNFHIQSKVHIQALEILYICDTHVHFRRNAIYFLREKLHLGDLFGVEFPLFHIGTNFEHAFIVCANSYTARS